MTKSTNSGGTGHCLCGAVRYRYEGEPVTIGLCQCQCDRCQRQSGAAFLIGVIFPRDAVTIEGARSMMGGTLDDKTKINPHFSVWCSAGSECLKALAAFRITRKVRLAGRTSQVSVTSHVDTLTSRSSILARSDRSDCLVQARVRWLGML